MNLKEKLKGLKFDVTFSAVLMVLLGVLFALWPGQVTMAFARIIAVAVILVGVVLFLGRVTDTPANVWALVGSLILLLTGVWLFLSPQIIVSVIPIVIGVLLVIHGVQDLVMAAEVKRYNESRWWPIVIMGALSVVFGVICICNAFGIAKLTMVLIGIMLIYDGLSDMIIVHKVNRASKTVIDAEVISEQDVSEEPWETPEDKD